MSYVICLCCSFWNLSTTMTLSCECTNHRANPQAKLIIAIIPTNQLVKSVMWHLVVKRCTYSDFPQNSAQKCHLWIETTNVAATIWLSSSILYVYFIYLSLHLTALTGPNEPYSCIGRMAGAVVCSQCDIMRYSGLLRHNYEKEKSELKKVV